MAVSILQLREPGVTGENQRPLASYIVGDAVMRQTKPVLLFGYHQDSIFLIFTLRLDPGIKRFYDFNRWLLGVFLRQR